RDQLERREAATKDAAGADRSGARTDEGRRTNEADSTAPSSSVVRPSPVPSGTFERDRRAVLGSIASTAREVVLRHDHARVAEDLANEVRAAVTGAALVEAGAIGFGALTLALMGSVAADLTGI